MLLSVGHFLLLVCRSCRFVEMALKPAEEDAAVDERDGEGAEEAKATSSPDVAVHEAMETGPGQASVEQKSEVPMTSWRV